MRQLFMRLGLALAFVASLAFGSFTLTGSAHASDGEVGHVYAETNATSGNAVLVYGRGEDGTLTPVTAYATGGTGTGAGLGSQGALALTQNGRWLLAVNAGSNDVSVLSTKDGSIADRVSSGGVLPISVTTHGNLVYVLNAGGSGNISGLTLDNRGRLTPIANSTRPLSGAAVNPAEVQFSSDGRVLVVTEKATNLIDVYVVQPNGTTSGPATHPSSGTVPFGFAFGKDNVFVVSEAAVSAASSYRATQDGGFQLITGSVLNGQQAACWVAVTNNGHYAYTADAHNGMISSYALANNGSLTLLNGAAGSPGGGPLDEAISRDDRFLYVLNPSLGVINAFAVGSNGALSPLPHATGIPGSAIGLVAQ